MFQYSSRYSTSSSSRYYTYYGREDFSRADSCPHSNYDTRRSSRYRREAEGTTTPSTAKTSTRTTTRTIPATTTLRPQHQSPSLVDYFNKYLIMASMSNSSSIAQNEIWGASTMPKKRSKRYLVDTTR